MARLVVMPVQRLGEDGAKPGAGQALMRSFWLVPDNFAACLQSIKHVCSLSSMLHVLYASQCRRDTAQLGDLACTADM